ncbi:MAG: hypothetical protein HUJ80_00935 [Firmicutes bacterium]|nr:hypothetical protein [Bacillota bacterium]
MRDTVIKKQDRRLAAVMLCLLFCLAGCGAKEQVAPALENPKRTAAEPASLPQPEPGPMPQDLGPFSYLEEEQELAGGSLLLRTYLFADGQTIQWGRLINTGEAATVFEAFPSGGTIRYPQRWYWTEQPFADGATDKGWIFADGDDAGYLFLPPRMYQQLENGCLKAINEQNGALHLTAQEEGFRLWMDAPPVGEGFVCDFMVMKGAAPLVDFDEQAYEFWMPYFNGDNWRWTFDGYYFPSETTYIPSGEDVFSNLVSCYLSASLMKGIDDYDCADKLNTCLLHTMTLLQNDKGFVQSNAVSIWLSGDYGIDGAYYDTRFNSDLAERVLVLWQRTEAPFCRDFLDRYMDFYESMAVATGWEAGGGLFVPDYWIEKEHRPAHTALNHQLAEISVLYKLSDALQRPALGTLGDRLLAAIEGTAPQWIMADSNLEYAILPDGSFGFTDYPYLTYNDLYDMQLILEKRKGSRSPQLQQLMDAKKRWMDKKGIKEYKQ